MEDGNENMTSYGTLFHLTKKTVMADLISFYEEKGFDSCSNRNLIMHPKGLTDLTEIWKEDILGDETSFE